MVSQGSGGAYEISQRMTAMVRPWEKGGTLPLICRIVPLSLCNPAVPHPPPSPILSIPAQVGWGATTGFAEDWTWNQSADMYALDPVMAGRLRKANPQVWNMC